MSQTYKVKRVSEKAPREVEGKHGTIYYITVQLEEHNKFVSVGKKSPDALRVGDEIYGDIIATEYDTDNFKAAKKPMGGGGYQKDEAAIRAMWAIKAAIECSDNKDDVEAVAKDLFLMVDRVKATEPVKQTGYEKAKAVAQKLKPVPVDDAPPYTDDDAPIDVNDIPF